MASYDTLAVKRRLADLLGQALARVAPQAEPGPVEFEFGQPADAIKHGDFSSAVALKLAKAQRRNPRDLAAAITATLPVAPWVERAEVAGPGFINFFLTPGARQAVVKEILESGGRYGDSTAGRGERVLVEFVSANPTGPLHVGHGRGAAYGASLANLLAAAGHEVTREYYVNDAGRQMDILALSAWLRYLQHFGEAVAFPSNAYQGDYVRAMAETLAGREGERLRRADPIFGRAPAPGQDIEAHLDALIDAAKRLLGAADYGLVHGFVLQTQLDDCARDLAEFGVTFERWFSEQSLFESGAVGEAVARLEGAGHAYSRDGALWFRSTTFGDEKDRVLRRENGQFTYFASDVAYHLAKYDRGFDRMIDVWGADHHGYVARIQGAMTALGRDAGRLEIALVQFAVLYRESEKVSMSTRSGEFVTLRELRGEVGNDAARFFYVLRKSDQHLDFDLDLAKSQSNDNPVYYVQYAHARVHSVLNQWAGDPAVLIKADLGALTGPMEMALLRTLMAYPEAVENAARDRAPHVIAYVLKELAASFHSYYNAERFLAEDERVRLARLALVSATAVVIRHGLGLLGVSCPEQM